MNVKTVAKNNSKLKFLRPMIDKVFTLLDDNYIKEKHIPSNFIPTSGREISLTPLFFHAAFDAYVCNQLQYTPSAEIKVIRKPKTKRKSQDSSGLLDLALISTKKIILIELKSRRKTLFGSNDAICSVVNAAFEQAFEQLGSIREELLFDDNDNREIMKVAIVTINFTVPESKLDTVAINKQFKNVVKFLRDETESSLISCYQTDEPFKVNSARGRAQVYSTGNICIAICL